MEKNTVGNAGLYLVNLIVGDVQRAGSPLLRLSLLVNPATGSVSGHGRQTQAIPGPAGDIAIDNITGQIRYTGLGEVTKIVYLEGNALITAQPPAIGAYLMPFSASFGINEAWEGKGGWTLGDRSIDDVPINTDKE